MPATVTDGRLGIECVFSDGSTARFNLAGFLASTWSAISWPVWWS